MSWRFLTALLGLSVVACCADLRAGSIPATRAPRLQSAAVVVQDQRTGEFLLAKHAGTPAPIASITKLMTAMVVLDAKLGLDEVISIDDADKDRLRHSRSHLPVGTLLTRGEALQLALMASENRAAHALARTYPGGVVWAVAAMNRKARALGLAHTRFEDPTGLSENNLSSAQDLALLVESACEYPEIRDLTTQKELVIRNGRKRLRFTNTNALVRSSRWTIGLSKTGYIEEAGRCLVMQTQLAQRPYLIVLLNSTGTNSRLADANRIKQWIEGTPSAKKSRRRRSR